MSAEDVEIVREVLAAWNEGDLDAMLRRLSDDWEWHTAQLFPGVDRVYRGRDGFVRFWETFREPWETIRLRVERLEDLGDGVLALITFHGRGKDSGVEGTTEYANVLTLRDGLITFQMGYPDWASALEAVARP